jgi:hypothetical protein
MSLETTLFCFGPAHQVGNCQNEEHHARFLRPGVVPKVLHESDAPPAAEWHEWDSAAPSRPGFFVVEDFLRTRLELHGKSHCPGVYLHGTGTPRALRVLRKGGDSVIRKRAPEAFICEACSAAFHRKTKRELVYQGDSLASFYNRALVELLKPLPTRKQLTANQHQIIREKQGCVCNLCASHVARDARNIDHIAPRFIGGDDGFDYLQIICVHCQASNTQTEALSFVEDESPLFSRFSMETYKILVDSPSRPQS